MQTEKIKTTIGSAYPLKQGLTMDVLGRCIDFSSTIELTSEEIREAISETVATIIDAKRLFERTAPELSADIAERGIF